MSDSSEFLLLDATGLPAALPLTRQGVHPWVALDTSNELASPLILLSGLPESTAIPQLSDAIGLDATEELVVINQEDIFVTAGRDLDTTFFLHFDFESSSSLWTTYQADILGTASGAEVTDILTNEEDCSTHHVSCEFPLVTMSASWCLVSM